MKRLILALPLAAMLMACSAKSPTGPTPTSSASNADLSVSGVTATTEITATGVTYHVTLTVHESVGRSAVSIASIRVNFSNARRSGGATFDASNLSVTSIGAGASNQYRLAITSENASDPYDSVSFVITFRDDRGTTSTWISSITSSVSPPAASTPSPSPSPSPSPAPTPTGGKYDGTYSFTYYYPQDTAPHTVVPRTISGYFIVTNGVISSPDGLLRGTVDANFGNAVFTSPCPIGAQDPATYRGVLNAGGLNKIGEGTYSCVGTPTWNWSVATPIR